MKSRFQNAPIKKQLNFVFVFSILLILAVNIYIFTGMNSMMEKVDDSYYSNAKLMELQKGLDLVRGDVSEYLQTKSTDSLTAYYNSEAAYRRLLKELDSDVYNSNSFMERSIFNMSDEYLRLTAQATMAKRGSDIDEFSRLYQESEVVYQYIYTYILSLNSSQFKSNTMAYEQLFDSFQYAEVVSVTIMFIVAVLSAVLLTIITAGLVDPLESHLLDARLKYLQAQINPHFLFNTLNAGAQLAMMEGADRTYTYIQNVADFYRYNINKNMDEATIAEEVAALDSYMYIISVRFAGEITYEKHLAPELDDIVIPAMILQPIVENCINHGLRTAEWDKKITLTLKSDESGKNAIIEIEDNGIGMSQERIAEILEGRVETNAGNRDSNGVGMGNVIQRLNLYYRSSDILRIESAGENQGTKVSIVIPLKGEKRYV